LSCSTWALSNIGKVRIQHSFTISH
jgi:hypothetical protein